MFSYVQLVKGAIATVSQNYQPEEADDEASLEDWEERYGAEEARILERVKPDDIDDEDYPPQELLDELEKEPDRVMRTYKREKGNLVHFYDLVNAFLQSPDEEADVYLGAIEEWYREDAAPVLFDKMSVAYPNKLDRPLEPDEYEDLAISHTLRTLIQNRKAYQEGETDLIKGDDIKKPRPLTEKDMEER